MDLFKDMAKIYNLSYIFNERDKITEIKAFKSGKKGSSLNIDIIIGLCYLYLPFCSHEEIVFWLKKEWNLEYSIRNIQSVIYNYQSKRAFQNYQSIFVLDTEQVEKDQNTLSKIGYDIIKTNGFYFTKNMEYIDKCVYFQGIKSGKRKNKTIGDKSNISKIKKNDGTPISIKDILFIKRFCYLYNISDMNLIESFSETKSLNTGQKNDIIVSIQAEFMIMYNKIEGKYFGGK